jgi:hypothetical protein
MRKLPSSPKLSPMDFEPDLVSTLKSVLDAAVRLMSPTGHPRQSEDG